MSSTTLKKIRKYGLKCALCAALEKAGGHAPKRKRSELYIQKYYLRLPAEKREEELKSWFQAETGKTLNLHSPQTFNEKIQWLKLYDSTPEKTRLADKYQVREWVRETIGEEYLIPLLGVWDSFEEIDFAKLPERFVLKCVHGSGMNAVIQDKSAVSMKKLRRQFRYWQQSSYGIGPMQEWHYRDIPHRIIAEQYMENVDGDLYDYKFYCFGGEPKYIQVIQGRGGDSQMGFYTLDWQDAGFGHHHFGQMKHKPARPAQLSKAIELARKLAQGFAFVRVDLYLLGDEQIYFGEMTFTPASGIRHWEPETADRMLGELMALPAPTPFDRKENREKGKSGSEKA